MDRTWSVVQTRHLPLRPRFPRPEHGRQQLLRHAHALLFPIRDTILNRARCPSKTFAYAQARRPVITNRVGEVPEVLGERARYVEISAEGFERAMEEAMRERRDDIDYNVEAHNWGARAQTLIDALGR